MSLFIMPRRYRRTYKNRDKYSIEQINFWTPGFNDWSVIEAQNESQQNSRQFAIDLVPPTDTQGMRKVKHLTISLANGASTLDQVLFYSIVYIPQGYESIPIAIPAPGNAIDNYPANQFVMSTGVIDFNGGPCRIRSRLSRNLNSGDRIGLILATNADNTGSNFIIGEIQYAITLQ